MKSLKKFAGWYFSKDALPYWSILILDCLFVMLAGIIAYAVNHDSGMMSEAMIPVLGTLCVFLVCFVIGFRLFHTYVGVFRYASFSDLGRVTLASVLGIILVCIVQWALAPTELLVFFSTSDLVMFGLFSVAFLWTVRIWVKTLYQYFIQSNAKEKAFVFGVQTGRAVISQDIDTVENSTYRITGLVSEEYEQNSRMLTGVRIYPFDHTLVSTMRNLGVKTLIVSPRHIDTLRRDPAMADLLIDAGIRILVMQEAREWDGRSELTLDALKPIDVEDLLPREQIEVDMEAAARLLSGHRVMITGAAGSIGSEMVRQIARYNPSQLILIDQAETPMHDIRLMMRNDWPSIPAETIVADITDDLAMERIFNAFRPEYVFHAAAYKHVPMMEDNPYESVINNIGGTRVVADLSVKYGTRKFVMVSTDKAVNPTNVMGCSKRICEIYVQSLDAAIKAGRVKGQTQFVTTRFGNVLGSNGSVIPLFQKQIEKGGPITVTHPDIIRFFMLIPEACKLVIEAGTMGKGGEIYVFDMGQPVKIADLARRMIRLSGAKNIEIMYTGLREGEKLYEEVLNDEEICIETFNPQIKIARVREYRYDEVSRKIDCLIKNSRTESKMEIVARMKEIVPEYKSKNSVYEMLDK